MLAVKDSSESATRLQLMPTDKIPGYQVASVSTFAKEIPDSKTIETYRSDDRKLHVVERERLLTGFATIGDCVFLGGYSGNGVSNHRRTAPYRIYDGKQFMFSADGFFTPDMMFCGNSLPSSLEQSKEDPKVFNCGIPIDNLPIIHEKHVFLGTYHSHFGHALVESLNRLWFLLLMDPRELRETKFVFFGGWGKDLTGILAAILDLFEIPIHNVLVCRADVRFKKLVLPSFSWRPWNDWNIRLASAFASTTEAILQRVRMKYPINFVEFPKNIYLSRAHLSKSGLSFNQRQLAPQSQGKLETLLNAKGYTSVYPETLSFLDQIQLISHAVNICGAAGSAQHLCAFADSCLTQTILTHSEFWMGSTDVVFTWDKKIELRYLFGEKVSDADGLVAPWTIDVDNIGDLIPN